MKSLAEQLKSARKKKRLSQAELAEHVEMDQAHLSRIEAGKVDLRYSSLQALAHSLDHEVVILPREYLSYIRALASGKSTERGRYDLSGDDD